MTYLYLSNEDVKDLKKLLVDYKRTIQNSNEVDHYEKGMVSGDCNKFLSEIKEAEKRSYEIAKEEFDRMWHDSF